MKVLVNNLILVYIFCKLYLLTKPTININIIDKYNIILISLIKYPIKQKMLLTKQKIISTIIKYPFTLVSFFILYIFSEDTTSNILIPSPSKKPIIKIKYLLLIFNLSNNNKQNNIFKYLKYLLSSIFQTKK